LRAAGNAVSPQWAAGAARPGPHNLPAEAARYLVDIFAVQDEVISKIVTVLAGKLVAGRLHERQRAANLDEIVDRSQGS
jgi:hypothetical protein